MEEDLLPEFLVECSEIMTKLDADLVNLEKSGQNPELMNQIFRGIHTIKGSSGFFELKRLESVAHAAENILDKMRQGTLKATNESTNLIFQAVDVIKKILDELETQKKEPAGDDSVLIGKIRAVLEGKPIAPPPPSPPPPPPPPPPVQVIPQAPKAPEVAQPVIEEKHIEEEKPAVAEPPTLERTAISEGPTPPAQAKKPIVVISMTDSTSDKINQQLAEGLSPKKIENVPIPEPVVPVKEPVAVKEPTIVPPPQEPVVPIKKMDVEPVITPQVSIDQISSEKLQQEAAAKRERERIEQDKEKAAPVLPPVVAAPVQENPVQEKPMEETKQAPTATAETASKAGIADQTLRVNIEILERLINMVGELVLNRNQLSQLVQNSGESKFSIPVQQLTRVTSELQSIAMRTRMQPIGSAWAKIPRLVRDLSQVTGKKVNLEMKGAETELDRAIHQAIQDPLTHMVRNCIDHGIEPAEVRRQSGKPVEGTVKLDSYQEGGHIVIEVTDDGGGINAERVRKKAIEKGLVAKDVAMKMPEADILNFIFLPGFSTAEQISAVSGRGVGMDVVKTNIEKIGGSVEIASRLGKGTSIKIKIPLTLAIISALIFQVGSETFAIPQVAVLEIVRVGEDNQQLIEDIHGIKVLRLRESLLPLVDLNAICNIPKKKQSNDMTIFVSQVGVFKFGIIVDEVYDIQEIVVKPIGRLLKNLEIFSGATIMGDGRVIMIVDVAGVGQKAGTLSRQEHLQEDEEKRNAAAQAQGEKMSFLIFRTLAKANQGVPLSLVSRLEEFPLSKIEEADGQYLVQYRKTLLPLVSVDKDSTEGLPKLSDPQSVIVFSDGDRYMGLLVNEIKDIVEEYVTMEASRGKPGILGVSVIKGQATEVIDVHHYLEKARPGWFKKTSGSSLVHRSHILMVDDSNFFKDLLRPVLEAKGLQITTATHGQEALTKMEKGERFDLILSDIEMPVMDGLTFVKKLKENPAWKDIPVLACTSLGSVTERSNGIQAGFDEYLVKFDREAILNAVLRVLAQKKEAVV